MFVCLFILSTKGSKEEEGRKEVKKGSDRQALSGSNGFH